VSILLGLTNKGFFFLGQFTSPRPSPKEREKDKQKCPKSRSPSCKRGLGGVPFCQYFVVFCQYILGHCKDLEYVTTFNFIIKHLNLFRSHE
jgi:hypothetical protein